MLGVSDTHAFFQNHSLAPNGNFILNRYCGGEAERFVSIIPKTEKINQQGISSSISTPVAPFTNMD